MACATLKRSLDWEALNQRPTKRRRCNPFGQSGNTSPTHTSNSNIGQQNSTSNLQSPYRRTNDQPSPFAEATLVKLSPDKMAQNIRDEIKRLHKRKQLPFSASSLERMQDSESSGSEMGPDSPRRPESPAGLIRNPEKALFTFKQVQLICERMLKEREDALREQYDAVLTTKLAEQYDAFVKFTYDQIQRRYEAAPSYLS
ncbi:akirin [Condylostylus longicornis]|uniref:akirin n=1 Tax=Condylostylus longicornis TaxID=2530218 RepID=UPI00244E0477|nr:akirin [Condylostylus longicornis]XP_055373316.1 akirin [Condylostylus longicornis]